MNQDLHTLKVTVISPNESMLAVTQLRKFHIHIIKYNALPIARTADNSIYFRRSLRVRVIEVRLYVYIVYNLTGYGWFCFMNF